VRSTSRATVNNLQAITSTLTTEAFGNAVAQWGSSANPYRFAGAWGYRDDGDAGLLHVGARYYDPQVGRFISRDAVLSEHPYLYCEHEPVNSVDPSGRVAVVAGAVVFVPGTGQVIAAGVIAVGATIALIWLAENWDWDQVRKQDEERRSKWQYTTQQPTWIPPDLRPPNHEEPPKGGWRRIVYIIMKAVEYIVGQFGPKMIMPFFGKLVCGTGSTKL